MIAFLLKQLERVSNPVFSKRELLAVSPNDFEELKRRKILTYYRPRQEDLETVRWPHCPHGCSLSVRSLDDSYEAFCLNHPEEYPILIGEDHLNRWRFSVDTLLEEIIQVNGIHGGQRKIEASCIHLGHKIYGTCKIGFVFLPRIGAYKQMSLHGIKRFCRDDGLVILTPASIFDEIPLESMLHMEKVIHSPLVESLDPRTSALPINAMVAPLLSDAMEYPISAIELTENQRRDREAFKYLCLDRIHIPGDVPSPKNNLILINGKAQNIPDRTFRLFLRLATALWEDKNGWVETATLWGEGLIPDPEQHQIFNRLREKLADHLLEKDAKRFLENSGTKSYRLSTHPEFITCDRAKLLNNSDQTIRLIVQHWLKHSGSRLPKIV